MSDIDVEALLEDLADAKGLDVMLVRELANEVLRLRAEVDRYRKALEDVLTYGDRRSCQIARFALSGGAPDAG